MSKSIYYPNTIEDVTLGGMISSRVNRLFEINRAYGNTHEFVSSILGKPANKNTMYRVIRAMREGKNVHTSWFANLAKATHINLYHMFNPDDFQYESHPYVAHNELETLDRNVHYAIEYAKYSKTVLTHTEVVCKNKLRSPFHTANASDKTDQSRMYSKDWLYNVSKINAFIRFSKLSNIPLYMLFNPDFDEFKSYTKTHCIPNSNYTNSSTYENTRRESRRKCANELDDNWETSKRLPVIDPLVRNAIMKHIDQLLTDHDMSRKELSRHLGVSAATTNYMANGLNSRVSLYLKLCDYFHVKFTDLCDPEIDELPVYTEMRQSEIDLFGRFLNIYNRKYKNFDLSKDDIDFDTYGEKYRELHTLRMVLSKVAKNNDKEKSINYKRANRILINTFFDYCKILDTTSEEILYSDDTSYMNTTFTRKRKHAVITEEDMYENTHQSKQKDQHMKYFSKVYDTLSDTQIEDVVEFFKTLDKMNHAKK